MYGVGLRPRHYREFLEGSPRVDFVEAISENFMGLGGRPLAVLEKARRDRPVFLHGVSLGLASAEPLDERYLTQWRALIERIEPAVVSDHLCWGRAHRRYSHDLLPFPFTHEALALCVSRVQQVQDFLGRQLTLENVSSYLTFARNDFSEWDFLTELVKRSGCGVLLDVNNIYVSAQNHGFDADAYLAAIPRESVTQFHLAGHQRRPGIIIDTHDGPVSDEVWALYARAKQRFGEAPTLIEWDDAVPELDVLLAEAEKARRFSAGAVPEPDLRPTAPPTRAGLELQQVQHTLFSAICDPEPVSDAAAQLVHPHGALTTTQRLEVYAEMYWLRMRDTLRGAFEKTRAAVGDERFDGFVADFLRAHPSTHFSLDRLGARFAQTLPEELRGAAELEWARSEAFLALDAPVVEFSALQSHPADTWASLALELHPSVKVVGGSTVVWRTGFAVQHAEISRAEAAALEAAQRGARLGEVLEPFGDDAQAAFDALASWFTESMVSRVRE